jgi:hypothetical protein
MTAMPRADLATKRSAEIVQSEPKDDGRTIDGQWRAPRPTGVQRGITVLLFAIVAALFAGYLLSAWQQYT